MTYPTTPRPTGPSSVGEREKAKITLLEGSAIGPTPQLAGATSREHGIRAVLHGQGGTLWFDNDLLSKHMLFLGAIGCGKTSAMLQLLWALRQSATANDVFVIFDTKGDFKDALYQPGDAVIANGPQGSGGVIWNLFQDLLEQEPGERADQIFEIATTIFSEGLKSAGDNLFFAAGACDLFAALTEIMAREGGRHSNQDLKERLEGSRTELLDQLNDPDHADLAGTARYLDGERAPEAILAFLQQTLNKTFSGVFRLPGDFSVRQFIRGKGGRSLFIEYDIAVGSRLLPIYRVLIDMAIKEALGLGRRRAKGNVYFILDEFALLPDLSHIADGINFGRSLGLKFVVATQNVSQILGAYGQETGQSILSGFGTVFAFRLMDNASRDLVRQRHGANRKRVATFAAVRTEGVQQDLVNGHVIEDWDVADLVQGQCVVSLPEGRPFFFAFPDPRSSRPA